MNSLPTGKASVVKAAGKMNPDVVVTHANQTALFEPQNRPAAEWLHQRCGLAADNITGDTEFHVHPRKCPSVIADLKAAGFIVAGENQEP
jgi:hypothetical protein